MTNEVLVDELNEAHAERIARAKAVAGAKSLNEAFALGAAYAQKEATESANAAAFRRGIASVVAPPPGRQVGAGSAAPAASVKAPAHAVAPPSQAPALVAGHGDIALRARRYQLAQERLGRRVSSADAVAHVTNTL